MEKGNKIMLLLGILALAAGFIVIVSGKSFINDAILTEGKVIYVLGSTFKIQYFTNDGNEIVLNRSGKTHGYHEGDSVKVWYKNINPEKARIVNGKKGAKTLFIISGICFLLGIYPLFIKQKK